MKQYIVFYPEGTYIDPATGEPASNKELAHQITQGLLQGATVCLPNTWRVQVVDAPDSVTIERTYTQEERDLLIRLSKEPRPSIQESTPMNQQYPRYTPNGYPMDY